MARDPELMKQDMMKMPRKRGGHVKAEKRKHGGEVHGEKSKHRPDRRARGGSISEPLSGAGNMSKPGYQGKDAPSDSHGDGKDRD